MSKLTIRKRSIRAIYFNLNTFSKNENLQLFCFRRNKLGAISKLLPWSGRTVLRGYCCKKVTAICIVACRVFSPARWFELEYMFGMSSQAMSEMFWQVLDDCTPMYESPFETMGINLLQQWARIHPDWISSNGPPSPNFIGFVNGTIIFMSRLGRPSLNQRSCYSGHKRRHCLVYLPVIMPDGLILYLYGPEFGYRHDKTLYRKIGLDDALQEHCEMYGQQFYVYVYSAFMMHSWLPITFNRSVATPAEHMFNTAMSNAWNAVEWSYKDVKQQFTTLYKSRSLKVRKASIALTYKMGLLLWNLKVCPHGGEQVGIYFECNSSSLEVYLFPLET